jgi:hypothetical protein
LNKVADTSAQDIQKFNQSNQQIANQGEATGTEAASDNYGPSQTAFDEERDRAFVKPRMSSLLPETAAALKKKWSVEAPSPVVPARRVDVMRSTPPEPPAKSWAEWLLGTPSKPTWR